MSDIKYYSKEVVKSTLESTKSMMEAARVLGCSYVHLKKFLKIYKTEEGIPFLHAYKNQSGKGMSKNARKTMGDNTIKTMDILTGKVNIARFTYEQIKNRVIRDKILKPLCHRCGYAGKRDDGMRPLILTFKDNNIKNFNKDNLELLCYNCYFMEHRKLLVNEEHLPGVNTFSPEYNTNSNVEYSDDITYLTSEPVNRIRNHNVDDDDDIYSIVAR